VTLRTADGSDPCGLVRWSICHSTPQGARECLGELCDDCQDNDADGLVDAEDPECCAAPAALTLKKARLKPGKAAAPSGKMVLRGTFASGVALDPMPAGLGVQLRNASGEVLCAKLATALWKRKGAKRPRFRWKDRSGAAAGITSAALTTKKAGLAVSVGGKKLALGTLAAGPMTVTVGADAACAATTAGFRAKGRALVFP
jgi:hypothetical protein